MAIIMLDWRLRPTPQEILSKIHLKLLEADHLQYLSVDISESNSKKVRTFRALVPIRSQSSYICPSSYLLFRLSNDPTLSRGW